MTKNEALRLALEALETSMYPQQKQLQAITAIKAALEAKDEPVAWLHRFIEGGISIGLKPSDLERHPERWEPLYTTPPQRKPLTDEEMDAVINGCPKYHGRFSTKDPDGKLNYYELVRAVEAAHGIKG